MEEKETGVALEPKEEVKENKFVLLPMALIEDLLKFLSEKPYKEVAPYIIALQSNGRLVKESDITEIKPEVTE